MYIFRVIAASAKLTIATIPRYELSTASRTNPLLHLRLIISYTFSYLLYMFCTLFFKIITAVMNYKGDPIHFLI